MDLRLCWDALRRPLILFKSENTKKSHCQIEVAYNAMLLKNSEMIIMNKQAKCRIIRVEHLSQNIPVQNRVIRIKIYALVGFITCCLFFVATFAALVSIGLSIIFCLIGFFRKWPKKRNGPQYFRDR